jgi:hypothetical protein
MLSSSLAIWQTCSTREVSAGSKGTLGVRYSDWTGYAPCAGTVQRFATPHRNRVTPFALTSPSPRAAP